MPISHLKLFFLILITVTLVACSETPSQTDNNNQMAATPDTPEQNKFEIAATMKIMAANPGLTKQQSRCTVQAIIKGGKIGLGEINQMKLTQGGMADNREDLNQAYSDALASCK